MSVESELREIKELLKEQKETSRYQRYLFLKETRQLPLVSKGGQGRAEMFDIPSYKEWNGLSSSEEEAQYKYYENDRR